MYKMSFLKVGKGTIVKWFAKRDFTVKLAGEKWRFGQLCRWQLQSRLFAASPHSGSLHSGLFASIRQPFISLFLSALQQYRIFGGIAAIMYV
jgi:hypothetical protein